MKKKNRKIGRATLYIVLGFILEISMALALFGFVVAIYVKNEGETSIAFFVFSGIITIYKLIMNLLHNKFLEKKSKIEFCEEKVSFIFYSGAFIVVMAVFFLKLFKKIPNGDLKNVDSEAILVALAEGTGTFLILLLFFYISTKIYEFIEEKQRKNEVLKFDPVEINLIIFNSKK
ncbi:hypothetical protein EQK45_16550 (plasmid) [Lactiplantibacillus plantarum]|uniref:hypothetical protein n=1 Tax=Lactiplantibacillus plantarum TaxID=1590 RepID=UPI000FF8D8B5|nr:hypothetical protein [Lactiplantibacillus plantarum]QAS31512.1 hypothetical protein EQK45_16550 [Lactiplantibacillus plantarum]